MRRLLAKLRVSALPLVTVLAVVAAVLAPMPEGHAMHNASSVRARVLSVDDSGLEMHGLVKYGSQVLEVEILQGDRKGERFLSTNLVRAQMELDKFFEAGDIITVALPSNAEPGAMLVARDHWRIGWIAAGFGAFALLLVAFGGQVGANALASFAFACVVIWRFVVPLALRGVNATLVAFSATAILTAAIMFLVGGLTRKALAAFCGAMLGVVAALLLAHFFGEALKINGATLPFAQTLVYSGFADLDLADVFVAATILAGSGAMMDRSFSQRTSHRPRDCRNHDDNAAFGIFGRISHPAYGLLRAGDALGGLSVVAHSRGRSGEDAGRFSRDCPCRAFYGNRFGVSVLA